MRKVLMLLLVSMFLVSFVSAEVFQFDNRLTYSEDKKTVLIENTLDLFGDNDIATVVLETPLHQTLDIGYQKVAQFKIYGHIDYNDFIDEVNFYDLNNGKEKITKTYDLKWLKAVNKYNLTTTSGQTYYYEEPVWEKLTPASLKKNENITVGLFTQTIGGEYIDWIPTLAGKDIDEWASYTVNAIENNTVNALTGPASKIEMGVDVDDSDYGIISGSRLKRDQLVAATFDVYVNKTNGDVIAGPKEFSVTGSGVTIEISLGIDDYTEVMTRGNTYYLSIYRTSGDWLFGYYVNPAVYDGTLFDMPAQDIVWADNGAVISYSNLTLVIDNWAPTTELLSPVRYYNTTSNPINFSVNINDTEVGGSGPGIQNVSLQINGGINVTNSTGGINNTYWFNNSGLGYYFADGTYNWSILAFDNASSPLSNQSVNRSFTIDTTPPELYITYPNETIIYLQNNSNLYLNWTIDEANFNNASYVYKGILKYLNTTAAKVYNFTYLNISEVGELGVSMYVNDTLANGVENSTTFTILSLETGFSYTATKTTNTYDYYEANITTNGSALSNAYLFYDGNPYEATLVDYGNGIYNLSYSQSLTGSGAKDLFFSYDILGDKAINTTTRSQTINAINFSLCSGTNDVQYLNFTFKDEATGTPYINATADLIDVDFWLTDESDATSYVDARSVNQSSYIFCFSPGDETVILNMTFKFAGDGWPLRTYTLSNETLTNETTNTTLWLLSDADGITSKIQVVNVGGDPIEGATVLAERQILGVWYTMAVDDTGADGLVEQWLNPNYKHRFTFTADGYNTIQETLTPSTEVTYIPMSTTTDTIANDYSQGIATAIYPKTSNDLVNDTSYNFIFNVTASNFWTVDSFGFRLYLDNGTVLGNGYSTVVGTGASYTYDVNNLTKINMETYYVIDDNYQNTTGIYWVVINDQYDAWSLKTFFTDLNNYMDDGIFGMDNFARYLIVFLVLFFTVGIMGFKYGMKNPIFISSLTFAVIFFFDVTVNMIPNVRGIENLPTYIAGIALVIIIIREASR